MTFLRNLGRDLVDKKLWPIALVLVVALVAIPVVLGGGAVEQSAPQAPPTGATGPSAAGMTAQVALAPAVTGEVHRAGAVRNPFKGPKVKVEQPDSAASTPDTKPDEQGGDTGTADSGKTDAPVEAPKADEQTVTKPKAKPDAESEPKVDEQWVAVLRFGVAGGEPRKLKPVPRLAPLPTSENPIIVFLGVLDDHKTALFLVGSDADTTGDGTCKPSRDECEIVRMVKDETQFFDVTKEDGSVVQYQLDLDKVRARKITKKAVAAKLARAMVLERSEPVASAVELVGLAAARVPGIALP